MRQSFKATLVAALLCLPLCGQADTLVVNANGYTLNQAQALQRFEALLFNKAGRVVATGTSATLIRQAPKAKRIDAGGATLLPGLIDAHGHVMGLGEQAMGIDLSNTKSLAEAQDVIRAYAAANPAAKWIVGRGWNQANWSLGRFPTAQELDAAVADRPAFLERVDGHAAWINSKALSMTLITSALADPAGGRIERDATGAATGILVDGAASLASRLIPPPTAQERATALKLALQKMASVGITTVHDAGITPEDWALYKRTAAAGQMTARIYAMIGGAGPAFDALSKQGPIKSLYQDRLALRAVKLYMDGALGSRGAALQEDYADSPRNRGLLFMPADKLHETVKHLAGLGYQVNIHAIGDAANHAVLEAFATLQSPASKALRHRIEHAQVIDPKDIARLTPLGLIASVQPTHATSDKNMAGDRLGEARLAGAYAWRQLINAGTRLAGGSDFPVEPPNPLYGWHAAVTRQDRDDQPLGGWRAFDALTPAEAFKLFTLDAAYAGHQEKIIGTLEPGKWADFILLGDDPFTVEPKNIWRITVRETWLAGKAVFKAVPPSQY
jgi:predicted amidohydrolase YtcJ